MWYVYAAPYNPETCPILSLDLYLHENSGIMIYVLAVTNEYREVHQEEVTSTEENNNGLLFPDGNQHQHFMSKFHIIINKNRREFD